MSENELNKEQPFDIEADQERQEKDHRRVISKLGELAIYAGSIAATTAVVIGVTDLLGEPLSLPVASAMAAGANIGVRLGRNRS